MRQDCVLGFAFSTDRSHMVLIRKTRPVSQLGKLNAIGGKIEGNETPLQALCREFQEETGLVTTDGEWHHFLTLTGPEGDDFCYCLFDDKILNARTMEDQEILIADVDLNTLQENAMANIPWMTALALDPSQPELFVEARYTA